MAYEKRGLRPFNTLERTQKELNRLLRLQSPRIPDGQQANLGNLGLEPVGVANGSITDPNGTLQLDRNRYLQDSLGLYFGTHDDHWMDLTQVAATEAEEVFGRGSRPPIKVVVTASNPRLKQVHVLREWDFDDWRYAGDQGWRCDLVKRGSGEQRPRPFRMPADGCVVTALFLLGKDLPIAERAPGRPWRKGSWLARADFRVTASIGNGLAPHPMNSEIRERFGLASHSTFFVDFRSEASGVCMATDLSRVMTVFIDEDLLKSAAELDVRNNPRRPAGGPLLNQWVMDTYRALVFHYLRDDQLSEFDPTTDSCRNTFLYSMLKTIKDEHHVTLQEAFLILKDQPFRFLALLEHNLAMKTSNELLLELKK